MKATVRHILASDMNEALILKQMLLQGHDFEVLAQHYSICQSSQQLGNLGEIHQGQLIDELDYIIFSHDLNQVHGPLPTEFGFHLIEIKSRAPIEEVDA